MRWHYVGKGMTKGKENEVKYFLQTLLGKQWKQKETIYYDHFVFSYMLSNEK